MSRSSMSELPCRRPVVILGGLRAADRTVVKRFALHLNAPVYAEALSGLREDEQLREVMITAGERMIAKGDFDAVIRIGSVPTLRFWRDLDESRRDLQVISFTRASFAGLSRGEVLPLAMLGDVSARRCDRDERFFREDRERAMAINEILDGEAQSELALVRRLSMDIPKSARVYLGNSLPIREWDLVATREDRSFTIEGNRGANGIDGQLSTFYGQCDPQRPNVAVVGDLTAMYDMNAPWIVPQLDTATRFRIYIINNGGGRIFGRVASLNRVKPEIRERVIENAHAITFDHWARMWSIADSVTELRPDAPASARAWQKYDALW
jgi:2-succinyl-5-enolpyruvyl-6-hydroxy-3-cyclohexene-1-carboxylate synthase